MRPPRGLFVKRSTQLRLRSNISGMESKPVIPPVIHVLIGLGIAFSIILLIVAITFIRIVVLKYKRLPPPPIPATLGEFGSRCGGPQRYPCKPGLVCDVTVDGLESAGVCVKDTRTVYPAGQKGDLCDEERGCAPGLVCDHAGASATGTCLGVATSSAPVR